jgi:proteasome lid subunit RPN8/RPN11
MLQMTQEILQQIKTHGAASYPYEGCGLLLGRREGDTNQAVAIFPVENRWEIEEEKRVRFAIAPEDMLRAELAAARRDLGVIGVFHSHPDHEAVASARDLAWAAWSGYSYLITEVRDGEPQQSRSWQLREDRTGFVEETLRVGED